MRKCWRQPGQLSARSLFPVCLAAITAISVRMAAPFQEASGSVSSIARAILKDAPVVILDEATASMDAENENLVQQALSVLLQGKTVLVIAHRMRTIANVDKVVVLEQGRVAETGTPEELLNQKGLFYRLAEAQTVHGC